MQIWRTPFSPQLVAMLRPSRAELPAAYQQAGCFHVGVHPQDPSLPLLRELRAAAGADGAFGRGWGVWGGRCHKQGAGAALGASRWIAPCPLPFEAGPPPPAPAPGAGLVSAETFAAASASVPPGELRVFMALLDVFSPNEAEAASMLWGPSLEVPEAARREPRRLTEPFLEAGARRVALRPGPLGAGVQEGASGEAWLLPAFPGTRVVDPTGCGNAFCGALLAALLAGEGLAAAAAWGCAAGSLVAECDGTPGAAPAELAAEAAARQAAVLNLAARV